MGSVGAWLSLSQLLKALCGKEHLLVSENSTGGNMRVWPYKNTRYGCAGLQRLQHRPSCWCLSDVISPGARLVFQTWVVAWVRLHVQRKRQTWKQGKLIFCYLHACIICHESLVLFIYIYNYKQRGVICVGELHACILKFEHVSWRIFYLFIHCVLGKFVKFE